MSAAARKPWPMRWIVASILLFIVPYTYVTFKFRKPDKAFEPYADMMEQANVKRLLDAGYTRVAVRAERPYPPLPAKEIVPASDLGPAISKTAGGLPAPLNTTLVELPRLPASYSGLITPATLSSTAPIRLQFNAHLDNDREQLGGASVYIRDDTIVIAPTLEPAPGALQARVKESNVLLTLPAGLLAPGSHTVTLVGANDSLRWNVMVH